MKSKKN